MSVPAAFQRDENFVPITNLGFINTKSITYVAGTTGAVGATTLFNVTGTVAMFLFAVCGTDLAGSGTIEVGVTGATAVLANQQLATAIDAHEVWHNGTLAIGGKVGDGQHVIDQDVIQTIGTDTVTSGTLTFYCCWVPLSEGAQVTTA